MHCWRRYRWALALGIAIPLAHAQNSQMAPDANSCACCHNVPIPGGAGDIVANVFVLGQRFDSVKLDHSDPIITRGALDETGNFVTALNFADSRAGLFGSGHPRQQRQ
jgi:hypothetical protein